MAGRRGFTLIESVVALLLLTVALLALAAGLAHASRLARQGRRDTRIAASALNRLERERIWAAGCAARAGSERVGAITVDWSSGSRAPQVARLTIVVSDDWSRAMLRHESLTTLVWCGR